MDEWHAHTEEFGNPLNMTAKQLAEVDYNQGGHGGTAAVSQRQFAKFQDSVNKMQHKILKRVDAIIEVCRHEFDSGSLLTRCDVALCLSHGLDFKT
jgi:hypothetical protein